MNNNKVLDKNGLITLRNFIVSLLSGKVDKISGKSLSANDYTDEDKVKLTGLPDSALSVETTDVDYGNAPQVNTDLLGGVPASEYVQKQDLSWTWFS